MSLLFQSQTESKHLKLMYSRWKWGRVYLQNNDNNNKIQVLAFAEQLQNAKDCANDGFDEWRTGNRGEINGNKQMHVIRYIFKRSHKIGHLPMNCINYAGWLLMNANFFFVRFHSKKHRTKRKINIFSKVTVIDASTYWNVFFLQVNKSRIISKHKPRHTE